MNDKVTDELEMIWKEAAMAQLRYCPGVCLEALSKTSNAIQDNQ
jgi:hypothetical protein